jgi:uncharacterized protein
MRRPGSIVIQIRGKQYQLSRWNPYLRGPHALSVVRGAVAVWVLLLAALTPAQAEQRLALVIGNGGYTSRPLANPLHDAALIARALQSTGFDVTTLIDADQATMKKAMIEFGRRLRGSDSAGVFYYAGHGVQIDGENYLIPVGADIKELEEVALNGVSLSELMRTMERASGVNLAILDACRDNPFATSSRSGARGLAAVSAPSGTLIAYATAPGRVALDGKGENSPYTAALAEVLPTEGVALEDVFKRTRKKVLDVTAGKQTPWEHSSLTGEFYFRPKTAAPEATARDKLEPPQEPDARLAEIAAWQAVKGSNDGAALRQHIAEYPDGLFTELATVRLAKLEQTAAVPSWPWTVTEPDRSSLEPSEAEGIYEEALKLDGPQSTEADLAAAATLYRRAAEAGLPSAMYGLGRSYDKGRGLTRNLAQAAQWYRAAADKGHAGAMASLGTMYEFGEGAAIDLAGAFRLYRQAAELGDSNAMTSLGYLYASGKGVAADPQEARRWYAMAAERGQTRAMFNLALLLMRGEGGSVDLTEASRLLQLAGSKGHAGALRELVSIYDTGRGVTRDPVQAADFLIESYAAANEQMRTDLLRRPEVWSLPLRREVQRKLQARGHYSGRLTGVFDAATRRGFARMASQR